MAARLGFRFSENMYGTYRPAEAPGIEHDFMFHIDAVSHDLLRTLRDGRVEATGYVKAEQLAKHSRIEGFMIIKPWIARLIRYEFVFTADDGLAYHYAGQKEIRHLSPLRTWTTLPGAIFAADGRELGKSVVRFDPNDMRSFVTSFGLMLRPARQAHSGGA